MGNTKGDCFEPQGFTDKEMSESIGPVTIPMPSTVMMEEKLGIQVILSLPMEREKRP
jgi:hypothetical protein